MSEVKITRNSAYDSFYITPPGGSQLEVAVVNQRFGGIAQPERWYVRQRSCFTDYFKKSTKLELLLRVGVSLEKIFWISRNLEKNECISLSPRKLPG